MDFFYSNAAEKESHMYVTYIQVGKYNFAINFQKYEFTKKKSVPQI